jgi:hypothetical protein
VEEIVLDSTRVEDVEGLLEAEGGRLSLDPLVFDTRGGRFNGTMHLDFNSIPFAYTFSLSGGPLDVAAWLGSDDGGGVGQGFLELEAEGFGADSKNTKASGKLTLESGSLPSTPIFTHIEETLGLINLAGAAYRATDVAFRLEHNQLFLEPFQLDADEIRLNLSGSVNLDGPVELSLNIRAPREGLRIADRVLDDLATEPGWVALPIRVTGAVEDPIVQLEYARQKE